MLRAMSKLRAIESWQDVNVKRLEAMNDKKIEEKLYWKNDKYCSLCNELKKLDKEIEELHKSIEDHNPEKLEQSLVSLKSQENDLCEQIKHIPQEEMQARIDKYNRALEQLEKATDNANFADRNFDNIILLKINTKKYTYVGQKKELEEKSMAAALRADEAKREMSCCQRAVEEAKVGVEMHLKLEEIRNNIKEQESLLDYEKFAADQKKLDEMQKKKASLERQKSSIFEAYKKKRKLGCGCSIIFLLVIVLFIALFILFPDFFLMKIFMLFI